MTIDFYCAENLKGNTTQAILAFTEDVKNAINSNQINNTDVVKSAFQDMYRIIFNDKKIKNKSDIFEFLLFDSLYNIAMENNKKTLDALDLYDKCGIIDGLTFFIHQLTDNLSEGDKINSYLENMRSKPYFKSNVFYFSRINRDFVRERYSFDIEKLNPRELYFSISTGYFFLKECRKELTDRLRILITEYVNSNIIEENCLAEWNINNPLFVLKRLYDDGFVPKLDTACKFCDIDSMWIEQKPTRYWG